jgi:hypothetical protein
VIGFGGGSMLGNEAMEFLPTAAVAAMTALGFAAVALQPRRPARKYWIVAVLFCGAALIGASAGQQRLDRAALADRAARLHEWQKRLADVAKLLSEGPGATPAETLARIAPAIQAIPEMKARISALDNQVRALKDKAASREIDPTVAAKLAAYLRGFGGHRVVVSCVPDDAEAFAYAGRIADILRDAGWEALGPEKTTIFGETSALGIGLYVQNGGAPPEAAKILLDALVRFNVPYENGITSSEAVPDPTVTELFVSRKP